MAGGPPPEVPSPTIWFAKMLLSGKVALITGGGSGIGAGIACATAKQGAWTITGVILPTDGGFLAY